MKQSWISGWGAICIALGSGMMAMTQSANAGGYALSVCGSGQQVEASVPALANNYTIAAWVCLRGGGSGSGMRVGILSSTNLGASIELQVSSLTSSAADPQYMRVGRCGVFDGDPSTKPVPTNQWVHLAVSVSSGKLATYYINGAAAGSWDGSSWDLTLGPNITLADNKLRQFNGLIDEVQIWSRALSQNEIQTNMCSIPALSDPNLVAYWPFNEGGARGTPGARTADASGHGHTGTLVNRPSWRISPVGCTATLQLNGDNPLTNSWGKTFVDPGAALNLPVPSVSLGGAFGMALRADGVPVAWGLSKEGQTNVPAGATNVVAISAGGWHGVALRSDGSLVSWGKNDDGRCNIPSSATNVVAVVAGSYDTLALRADGTLVAWGDNYAGEDNVPASATNVVAVDLNYFNAMALRADGTVLVWGSSDAGLGNLSTVPNSATNIVAISLGENYAVALKADGTPVAWGNNDLGQLNVPASATNVIAIAAGYLHTLALRADGTLVAWGLDVQNDTHIPARATNLVAISASLYASMALTAKGTVLGWGADDQQQIDVPSLAKILPATTGTVAVKTPGAYTLTYSYTNSLGSVTNLTRTVVVPVPLLLSGLSHSSGVFGFNISGPATCTVILEACTNLASPAWVPLQTNTLSSGAIPFSDAASSRLPQRFYRLRVK